MVNLRIQSVQSGCNDSNYGNENFLLLFMFVLQMRHGKKGLDNNEMVDLVFVSVLTGYNGKFLPRTSVGRVTYVERSGCCAGWTRHHGRFCVTDETDIITFTVSWVLVQLVPMPCLQVAVSRVWWQKFEVHAAKQFLVSRWWTNAASWKRNGVIRCRTDLLLTLEGGERVQDCRRKYCSSRALITRQCSLCIVYTVFNWTANNNFFLLSITELTVNDWLAIAWHFVL